MIPSLTLLLATLALAGVGTEALMQDENNATATNATNATQPTPTGPITTDAMCGPDHNNTVCVLDGIAPCCSQNGFCGGDKRYCSAPGCQPLFGLCQAPNSSTLGNPPCSWSSQGTSPRCDGQCGVDHNNALCDASAAADAFEELGVFGYGPCCSKAGFCGNTSEHCERDTGCQNGCWGTDDDDGAASSTSLASGLVSTVTVTATKAASATGAAAIATAMPDIVFVMGIGAIGMALGV